MQTTTPHRVRAAGYLAAAALALGTLAVSTMIVLASQVFDGAREARATGQPSIPERWMRPGHPGRLAAWKAPALPQPATARVVWVPQAPPAATATSSAPPTTTAEPTDDGGGEEDNE